MAAYMLSHLHLVYERGETSYLMGEYSEAVKAGTPADVNLLPESSTCEYCGGKFKPEKKGQRYCPPPDDGTEPCGRKASLEAIHKQRDVRTIDMPGVDRPHYNTPEQIQAMLRTPSQVLAEAAAETPTETWAE